MVKNPFGQEKSSNSMVKSSNSIEIEAQRAIAEVQASMVLARQNPRNEMKSCDKILTMCGRSVLAEKAMYSYARGGTNITGPSIRLAEAIAQQWGNLNYGWKTISSNDEQSEIETFAWDLETNVKVSRRVTVPHVRYAKGKTTPLKDPRDIYEVLANNASRRMRACILEVIPTDVVEMATEQCLATLQSNVKTDKETIKNMVEAFKAFGVSKSMIEGFIQRSITAITSQNVIRLKQIYQSIKDGMGDVGDYFKVDTVEMINLNEAPQKQAQSQAQTQAPKTQPEAKAKEKEVEKELPQPNQEGLNLLAQNDPSFAEDEQALYDMI